MSGVGGIHGKNTLASYLVQVAASRNAAANDGDADDQKAVASGPSTGGAGTGPSNLKAALISALTGAQKNRSPGDSPADLLKLIQQTLTKTLKDNGVDLSPTPSGAASKNDNSKSTTILFKLLNASGLAGPSSDLSSLLGNNANASGQQQLLNLLQKIPAGFNFSALA